MNKSTKSSWRSSVVARDKNGKSSQSSKWRKSEAAYFKSSRGEPAQVTAASYSK
jgi:hypothetical protein